MNKFFILLAVFLSGCEAIRTMNDDDRTITHDCNLTLPDGTEMQCGSTLEKKEGERDEGAKVTIPGK
jgi:hypothetical protein